jgi:hypothetical protein
MPISGALRSSIMAKHEAVALKGSDGWIAHCPSCGDLPGPALLDKSQARDVASLHRDLFAAR